MLKNRKNILLLFFGLVILFFAYFSYQQNKIIGLLNQEIIKLANQRQKTILEKYSLQKELDRVQDSLHISVLDSTENMQLVKNEE